MLPFKKILCPTDFSEPSTRAVKVASELAMHFSAEVCLLHVIAPIPVPVVEGADLSPGFDVPSYQLELETLAERSIKEMLEKMLPKELKVRPLVGHGDAANEIVRIAEEEKFDLIVIATHGTTGWRHLIFGSVAEKVVRLSPCPVLTIRATEKRD